MPRRTEPVVDFEAESGSEYESEAEVEFEQAETSDFFVQPGLILKSQYLILKKIGNGVNASVFMTYCIPTQNYLAIKICNPDFYEDAKREISINNMVNEYSKSHPDSHFVSMLDCFCYAIDDNNKLVCIVYELYADSIQMLLDSGKYKYGLPVPVVKRITRQLLGALAALHNDLSIIHTDIKLANILFKGPALHQEQIIEYFNRSGFQKKYDALVAAKYPASKFTAELDKLAMLAAKSVEEVEFEPIVYDTNVDVNPDAVGSDVEADAEDNSESEADTDTDSGSDSDSIPDIKVNARNQSVDDLVHLLSYRTMHDLSAHYDFSQVLNNRENSTDKVDIIDDTCVLNCEIAICDFGNAYAYANRTRNEIQDRKYRSPEVILDLNYNFACDIWSVSCVVFELLTGFVLFDPDYEPITKDVHHLFLMEATLGPIPLHMKKKSKRRRFLFENDNDLHLKNVMPFDGSGMTLASRLERQFLFSPTDAKEITDFLLCGFTYDPQERASATTMLAHPWLN